MALPDGLTLISEHWRLTGPEMQFGSSLSLRDQTVGGPTPLWTAALGYRVPLIHSPRWLEWEAWVEARRGRLVAEDIVPRAARMLGGWTPGIPFTGDITFEGGITFEPGEGFGETVTLAAAAAQFATELSLLPDHTVLPLGRFFWLGGAMHRVVAASPGAATVQPPLRAAAAAGALLTTTGTVRMTLAEAGSGSLTLTGGAHERATITLIEEV